MYLKMTKYASGTTISRYSCQCRRRLRRAWVRRDVRGGFRAAVSPARGAAGAGAGFTSKVALTPHPFPHALEWNRYPIGSRVSLSRRMTQNTGERKRSSPGRYRTVTELVRSLENKGIPALLRATNSAE